MIATADASLPVTGEVGDPEYGNVRVCQYHDADTGSLMYRIEKESAAPADEAEMIAAHVNAAYAKRLLSFIQSQDGGELGAKGCLLLIRGTTLASDSAVTVGGVKEVRAGFPDPRRPTKYNPKGSPDWQSEQSQVGATDAKIVDEHPRVGTLEAPSPVSESPAQLVKEGANPALKGAQDSLF